MSNKIKGVIYNFFPVEAREEDGEFEASDTKLKKIQNRFGGLLNF
jgi:hypothetical protein